MFDITKTREGVGKKLRIDVLNRTFSTLGGGAERYSIALVEHLAARHEIHVFAQEIDHIWPGVRYHKVSSPFLKPRWVNQLWFAACTWRLTRSGFDIVHSHENTWHGNIQTVHVLPVKYNLLKRPTGWRLFANWIRVAVSLRLLVYLGLEHFRFSVRANKRIVVTSDSLQIIVETTFPACKGKISVITPGITMPNSPTTPSRKVAARVLLGLPTDGYCILFVANDYRKKGLDALLEALALCPPDFKLAVVGNNSHQNVYVEQVKHLNLSAQVFFVGKLKDIAPAYEAADCLAHPTLEDTFAMVVLEAMSYGLPVLVSSDKYCGISGLLHHGINAWIVDDPTDSAKLHEAIEKLIDRSTVDRRMGHSAKEFAVRYQWSGLAMAQESVYQTALASEPSEWVG